MGDYIGGPSNQFRPKVIPDGWDWVLLPTVCRLESGHTPDRKRPEYWNGTIKWVSLQDTVRLDDNEIATTAESVTAEGIANSSARVLPAGTVIFSRTATVGKATILASEMATSQDFVNWICGERVHNAYLMQALRGMERTWQSIMAGSTHNTIYMPDFKRLCILLPPVDEQKVIARTIAYWDRGIRQLSRVIARKLELKRGLMQQLLTGRRRFPEFHKSQFVERHIGDILVPTPRLVDWDDTELYRLASIRRNSGGLFWREALRGKQIKVKKLHSLEQGDFLISHIQAAYGAMGLVPKEFAGGKVSDMYTILTPAKPNTVDMRYIDYLSQMKRMRHQAYLACNGFFAERLRLNFDPAEFLKQKILLPESIDEQAKIADLLDSVVREIRLLERKLDALKDQKKGLMQKLLTGQVRVKVR